MNIVVTGASGFIGRFLCAYLKHQGHNPIALQRIDNFPQMLAGDFDCLIHLAGRAHNLKETEINAYELYKAANVDYALSVADLARKIHIRKFIFLSSIGVNGSFTSSQPFTETDTPQPHSLYAKSKLEAETALKLFFKNSDTALTIIRPPLVYGPEPKANFRALLKACRSSIPLPFGAIDNRRSLISVDNLSHFIMLCCTHPAANNQTFLISDDHDISLRELVSSMRKMLNKSPRIFSLPLPILKFLFIVIGMRKLNQQLLQDLQINTNKAKLLLNWRPLISFEQGMQRAVKSNVT